MSSLTEILNTAFTASYGSMKGARPSIINATAGTPFVVPFETIAKVRLLCLRVRSGHIELSLTTALGALQRFPVSDLFMTHNPYPGDEITAIQIVGTGDVEYVLSGDVT